MTYDILSGSSKIGCNINMYCRLVVVPTSLLINLHVNTKRFVLCQLCTERFVYLEYLLMCLVVCFFNDGSKSIMLRPYFNAREDWGSICIK